MPKVHEIPGQGSLLDEPGDYTGQLGSAEPSVAPHPGVAETHSNLADIVPAVQVAERKIRLLSAIGNFAKLSRTGGYETIHDNIWFQNKILQSHPNDYQQHVDEVLANRDLFKNLAKTDFYRAFGVEEMVLSGLMTEDEARAMANDFYYGHNTSGYNTDENGNAVSFARQFSDPKNQKNREALRKKLK